MSGRAHTRKRLEVGPAILLLHGFPETSLTWRTLAPILANEFSVVVADLPGYGDSMLAETAIADGRVSKALWRTTGDLAPVGSTTSRGARSSGGSS